MTEIEWLIAKLRILATDTVIIEEILKDSKGVFLSKENMNKLKMWSEGLLK